MGQQQFHHQSFPVMKTAFTTLFVVSTSLVLVCMSLLTFPVCAQQGWCNGSITLLHGIICRGQVIYHPQVSTVQFRANKEATTWQTYSIEQFSQFNFITNERLHAYSVYDISISTGETKPLLFKELIIGGIIPLLELASTGQQSRTIRKQLPRAAKVGWQTEHPWFVWYKEQLMTLDTFVDTELEGMLAALPAPAQRLANRHPRPTNPKALARWLACVSGDIATTQSNPVIDSKTISWKVTN